MKPAIYLNSVIYTPEGITKHAREEAKELQSRGYKIFLTDNNFNDAYGKEFHDMYNPINRQTEQHIHYMIQPPYRANNIPMSLVGHMGDNNIFYYLAFESKLPHEWVKIINQSNVRVVLVPSKFNKKMFEKSGVIKPIEILPHGVDESFAPVDKVLEKDSPFRILWAGTVHNQRKGLKYMWQAWEQLREKIPSAQLTLKVSGIYGLNERQKIYLDKAHIDTRVTIIDSVLTDEGMSDLFKEHHLYISPHLEEGFGMNIIQAMACGTPTICSGWGGCMDFAKNNALLLNPAEQITVWEEPYQGQIWNVPDAGEIVMNAVEVFDNYDTNARLFHDVANRIHKDYSWKAIINKFEKLVDKYGKI